MYENKTNKKIFLLKLIFFLGVISAIVLLILDVKKRISH